MPHVEYRLGGRQRLYWLVVGALWLPVAALRLAAGGWVTALVAALIAAALAGTYLVAGRFGVTLTPHDVVVRGVRQTAIDWREIRDVTAVDFLGSRRVALHHADGSITRPWAPMHSWAQPDPHFDAKFHTIYAWWSAGRDGGRPPYPSGPNPPVTYARPQDGVDPRLPPYLPR